VLYSDEATKPQDNFMVGGMGGERLGAAALMGTSVNLEAATSVSGFAANTSDTTPATAAPFALIDAWHTT
jgi:hypothetical protein